MAVKWSELKKTRHPGVRKDAHNGQYRLRVQLKCSKTGKILDRSRWSTAETATAAAAERARFLEEVQRGEHNLAGRSQRETLSDFAGRWIVQKRNEGLRLNSLRQFINALDKFILPFLGDIIVDALTPMDVRQWQISIGELRKPGGGRYSQWTIAGWVAVLRNVLRDTMVEFGLQVADMSIARAGPDRLRRDSRRRPCERRNRDR